LGCYIFIHKKAICSTIEVINLATFLLIPQVGTNVYFITFIEVIVLLIISVICDIKTYKINNTITYLGCTIGLLTNSYYNGAEGLLYSLLGIISPILFLWVFYSLRMIGAGDIKLFSAIGAIMGFNFTLYNIIYSFLLGGILAMILMLIRKNLKQRLFYLVSYFKSCVSQGTARAYTDFSIKDSSKFHFSIAIMIGAIVSMCML